MRTDRNRVHEGMAVHSHDGKDLGKIARLGADSFVIEKGWFFPKDYEARYEEIESIDKNDIYLLTDSDVLQGDRPRESRDFETATMGTLTTAGAATNADLAGGTEQEVRVPRVEEELQATKHVHQTGEVEIQKKVVTEHRTIDVPVSHEEVHIERTATSNQPATPPHEEVIRVPVMEEEIEVTKRPVVREEIHVTKSAHVDTEKVEGDIKKEKVDIKERGKVNH